MINDASISFRKISAPSPLGKASPIGFPTTS
jgi:hypothetical protein